MLQEKLNQCYKDIQKLSSHRAHDETLSKSTAFDSREPLSQRAVLVHQAVQTEATDKRLETSFTYFDEKYLVASNHLKQSVAASMPSERQAPSEATEELKKQLQEKADLVEQLQEERRQYLGAMPQVPPLEGLSPQDLQRLVTHLCQALQRHAILLSTPLPQAGRASDLLNVSRLATENAELRRAQTQDAYYESQIHHRDLQIQQLKEQVKFAESQMCTDGSISGRSVQKAAGSDSLQELKLAMTKLWVKYEEIVLAEKGERNAAVTQCLNQHHAALKTASSTILKLGEALFEREVVASSMDRLRSLALQNRVLAVKQRLLESAVE